jgi:S-adenosylmethionine:tRNA ribosyltransferase-isomerase
MLVLERATGAYTDGWFRDLVGYLREGDLLVLNDSRVIPARLYATREGLHTQKGSPDPSGRIEVLLTEEVEPRVWSALVKPGKKVKVGERLHFRDETGLVLLEAEVLGEGDFGERTLRFGVSEHFLGVLERIGHMPLPPYIHRDKGPDSAEDRERYQTVYSRQAGSAAAPTAGLHFTPEILGEIRDRGVRVETVTLHVGLGTFQPVRVEDVGDIRLHEERYTLSEATAEAINRAKAEGRRVIAAGTTTTRTLEHCAVVADGRTLEAHSGATSIFISPGYRFRVIDGLLTNFHLPQSTLLMLVSAFAGRENVLAAYEHAVRERYRFFSYGDCMLIV